MIRDSADISMLTGSSVLMQQLLEVLDYLMSASFEQGYQSAQKTWNKL